MWRYSILFEKNGSCFGLEDFFLENFIGKSSYIALHYYKLKVFKIMVENNEVRKVAHDPYCIAWVVHILLRLRQSNQLEEAKKCIWLCALNNYKGVLDIELLYKGDKEDIDINIEDFFIIPIHVGAKGIIIVVKNLSATIVPSPWDQEFKETLLEASELMDLPLLGYIIINENEHLSLKAAGLL
jgi:DNA repair protein RadC